MAQLQLAIEDGIPIPPATTRQGSNITLLKSMKPGQSVFFGAADVKKATRFYRVAKKIGVPIVIRKVEGGMRMWRIEAAVTMTLTPPGTYGYGPIRRLCDDPVVQMQVNKKRGGFEVKPLTPKQRREAKNAKDRERRAAKKKQDKFPTNL